MDGIERQLESGREGKKAREVTGPDGRTLKSVISTFHSAGNGDLLEFFFT